MRAILLPHPTTPDSPLGTLEVELERDGGGLWLRFVAEGDVDRIAWPEPAASARADGLWKTTCFEAFALTADGYREFNLSPSGRWASYAFDGYRAGMREAGEQAVVLGLDGAQDMVGFEGRVELPSDVRSLALSAVIEDVDGRISYWALAHPSDKPDFHHPDSFVLELP